MLVTRRPLAPDDEPFVRSLILATVAEELRAWAWPEPMRSNLLEMQYRVRRQGVESTFPDAEKSIVMIDGQPAGWVVVSRTSDEIHLVDIAILAEWRGAGVGTTTLRELLAESDRAGKPIRLTVNVTNRAALLYERLGFRRTGGNQVQHFMERQPFAAP